MSHISHGHVLMAFDGMQRLMRCIGVQVEERFRKRGGVPRVVYDGGEDVLDPTQGDLGLALDNMDFTEVLRASSAISRFSAKASHQLILLNVPDWRKGEQQAISVWYMWHAFHVC